MDLPENWLIERADQPSSTLEEKQVDFLSSLDEIA